MKIKKFISYIASRRFAIILLIVTTAVIMVTNLIPNPVLMGKEEAAAFIREKPFLNALSSLFHVINITKSPFFLVLPVFLVASIFLCTFNRIRSKKAIPKESSPGNIRTKEIVNTRGLTRDEIVECLKKMSWSTVTSEKDGKLILDGRRGEGGLWGSVLFHAGMIVIIIGAFISSISLYNQNLLLTEGYDVMPGTVLAGLTDEERAEFPLKSMLLDSFEAVYEGGQFPVDYSANLIIVDDKDMERHETLKVNKPVDDGAYQYMLSKYSFAPRFIIKDKGGEVLFDSYINLTVTGVEQEDSFKVPDLALDIRTRFIPDFKREDDRLISLSMEPNNPVFLIDIYRWDKKIGASALPLNKWIKFDDGKYSMGFQDLRKWVTISVARDSGLPAIQAGLLMMVLGLILRFILNDKRVIISITGKEENPAILFGGKSLYFPVLFEEELRRVMKDLGFEES